MTELRKGDKVSVTGTVKYTPDKGERVFVKIDGSHEELWTEQSAVKLVQAAFEVGDRVGWDNDAEYIGEILAISGGHAWIEYANGEYCTRTFSSIERLPDEAEAAPEEVEPRTAAGSLD
jgi:hypothetical protein